MRRGLPLLLAALLAVGSVAVSAPRPAAAGEAVRPHTALTSCPDGSTRLGTYGETDAEIEYNDDILLCDWGPQPDGVLRFDFTNNSPVVWAFQDAEQKWLVPQYNTIQHQPSGVAPLFSKFAAWAGMSGSNWIAAPGETVSLASVDSLAWAIANPTMMSSWLVYKWQADKLTKLGKDYAKRIATTGYASRTRTFLWNCVDASVTARNTLTTDTDADPLDFAATWLTSAKKSGDCVDAFTELFPKKSSSRLPTSTGSIGKWFNTRSLSTASAFVGDIRESRAWMSSISGWIRALRV